MTDATARNAALQEVIDWQEREQSKAYNALFDAQERYDEEAGERAQDRINAIGETIETLRDMQLNPDYFGPSA